MVGELLFNINILAGNTHKVTLARIFQSPEMIKGQKPLALSWEFHIKRNIGASGNLAYK